MQYITKTFTLATPNLSLNGLPLSSLSALDGAHPTSSAAHPLQATETYAPFDARLRARVEELTRDEEDLLRDIAALKRTVPAAAAAQWGEAVRRGIHEDEDALAAQREALAAAEQGGADKEALAVAPLERQADVQAGYESAAQGLGRLKREMPAVVARMERARGAGGYVVTER